MALKVISKSSFSFSQTNRSANPFWVTAVWHSSRSLFSAAAAYSNGLPFRTTAANTIARSLFNSAAACCNAHRGQDELAIPVSTASAYFNARTL